MNNTPIYMTRDDHAKLRVFLVELSREAQAREPAARDEHVSVGPRHPCGLAALCAATRAAAAAAAS